MIISGGARTYWREFADHLMKTEDGLQRVSVPEIRGLAADNVLEAFRELDMLGSGVRSRKFYYHANINPRDEETLTLEQWEKAIDTLEKNLGLEDQPRFIVEHEKNGRTHRHVIWSRVDTDSMTVVSDSNNYGIHMRTADALEKELEHERTPRGRGPDGPNPTNREAFRGRKNGVDVRAAKAEIKDLWQQSDAGGAFAAALDEHGFILAEGTHGLCAVHPTGQEFSIARQVGLRVAQVDARMAGIDRDALPTVEEARELARKRAAERKENKEASKPGDRDSATALEIAAEELLHAAKEALTSKERPSEHSPAASAPEPSAFERVLRETMAAADKVLPVLDDAALAVSAVEAPSEFERFVQERNAAMRAAACDEDVLRTQGVKWLAEKIPAGTSAATPELTAFDRYTREMSEAVRENGGQPVTGGNESFWQRGVALLREAGERVAQWARQAFESFVGRLSQDRDSGRDEPGLER